jgi:hypothetical protein
MLRTETPDKSLQRQFELSSALEPGAMDSVARPINVAAPNTLQTEQDIAVKFGTHSFQFTGKSDWRFFPQARDRSEWPFGVRPVIRRNKLHVMPGFDHTAREAFQVRLRATRRRIAASDKDDAEFFRVGCHFDRSEAQWRNLLIQIAAILLI